MIADFLKQVFGILSPGGGNSGITSVPGASISITATAPAATSGSQAGVGLTFTASNAVDGSSTHAAAAGGNLALIPGAGVNAGAAGYVRIQQPGGVAGTNEVQFSWGTLNTLSGTIIKDMGGAGPNGTILHVGSDGAYCGVNSFSHSLHNNATPSQVRVYADGSPGEVIVVSGGYYAWTGSTTSALAATDSAISRLAAASLALGNGTSGDKTGGLTLTTVTGPGAAGLTVTNASGNLTVSTTTSGTLAATSAGALNLTSAAASTWSVTSGGLTINSTSANLTVKTTTSGSIQFQPNGLNQVLLDVNSNVVLYNVGAALATTATNGFVYIPNCAGAPTGVPATLPTGATPMVYDTTNHKIWFYDAGWKGVAVA